VEKQLEDAIKKMRQAEAELERAKREEATQQQRQAEENLRAAIDRLEQILRQLREEEMQRELARLEARLRKIASMQTKVLDDTVALAQTPVSQRNRQTDVKAGDLAFEEKKITMETDRAMLLLREEGSSVAFPEMVAQIRSDTVRVAELLGQTKIDAVTQGIQQDILTALEEMIGALQKAQRDTAESPAAVGTTGTTVGRSDRRAKIDPDDGSSNQIDHGPLCGPDRIWRFKRSGDVAPAARAVRAARSYRPNHAGSGIKAKPIASR
jgi:DNA repair exonuclease SbcCD ATPase subunit